MKVTTEKRAIGFIAVFIALIGILLLGCTQGRFSEAAQRWYIAGMVLTELGILVSVQPQSIAVKKLKIVVTIGTAIFSYLMFQVFIGADLVGTGKTILQDLINVLCCLSLYALLYVVCGRCRLSLIIGSTLMYLFGWVVYAVAQFRGELLLFPDFFAIRTAMQVASSYHLEITGNAMAATLIFVGMLLWIAKTGGKAASKKVMHRIRLSAAGFCLLFFGIFFYTNIEQYAYTFDLKKNGYPYSFMMSVKMFNVRPPEGYESADLSAYIQKKMTVADQHDRAVETEAASSIKPNIIAVMNESFSDLSVMGDFETNIPITPFIDSLKENTIRGNLSVSVFGGGTCDSEYAFLTGNTTAYLPDNARPYQQYIHQAVPGLVNTLKDQGYSTLAVHSGWGTAWNRKQVYPLMGFDRFISEECEEFANAERTRNFFISDRANYQVVEEAFEQRNPDQPFFAFDVTISNHSAYDKDASDLTPVWVKDHQGEFPQTEQYLSLMHRSDADFKELIDYFSKVDEPTIVLMFGDHQGYVDDSFYEYLKGKPLSEWNMEELQSRNTTPFMLWANYDIPEAEIEHLSINYLGSLLLETAGLEKTAYDTYLLDLAKELPVINTLGYMDKNGHYYGIDESSEYDDRLLAYQQILYNNIMDEENREEDLFMLPEP